MLQGDHDSDLARIEERSRKIQTGVRLVAWSLEALLADLEKNPDSRDHHLDIGEGIVYVMGLLDSDARSMFTFF